MYVYCLTINNLSISLINSIIVCKKYMYYNLFLIILNFYDSLNFLFAVFINSSYKAKRDWIINDLILKNSYFIF